MRRWEGTASGIGLAVVLMCTAAPAWATGIGYVFDPSPLSFSYSLGAGPGGKVGTITISDDEISGSLLSLTKLDLGADNAVGGGGANADTDLDYAKIMDASAFDVRIVVDVIRIASNDYRLQGTLKITDTGTTLSNPKVFADFASNTVSLTSGFFYFEGGLAASGSNDAILLPSSSSWTYDGVLAETPVSPNADGVRGRVTQSSDRDKFTFGGLNGGYYAGGSLLDTFFSSNQSSTSISAQAVVLPEPVSLVLGLAGFGWLAGRRRR